MIICFIYNNVFIYYCTVFGYSRSNNVVFLLRLLCYTLTPWMLFLFFLCPGVIAALVSIITYKVFVINILYIYTFNYLYLKQSFLPYFVVVSYCFLNPVWFAFKLFTSSLPPLHCCWNVFFFSSDPVSFLCIWHPFLFALSVLYGSFFVFLWCCLSLYI